MESTPEPVIPDPASPSPTAPAPETGHPKIRSRPLPINRAYRLPGTYAANFGGEDMNWQRGLAILWVLFGLSATVELVRGGLLLLAGIVNWPSSGDLGRVGISVLVFAALWLGWRWVRWVAVGVDFCVGVSTAILAMIFSGAGSAERGAQTVLAWNSPVVMMVPSIALGLVYLVIAGYLALSTDVIAFVRHRRGEGRGWVVVPVVLLGLAYGLVMLLLPVGYQLWSKRQPAHAKAFGDELSRRMAEHWDPKSIEGLGDARFDGSWSADWRRRVFASLVPLGPLEKPAQGEARQVPTAFNLGQGGFIRRYDYTLPHVRFAHGRADLGILIVKPLFRPWGIDDLQMEDVHYDPKPTPTPAPTPEPTSVPVPAMTAPESAPTGG